MASSVLTFFLNNPIVSGGNAGTLDLTQPATSTSTTGWTVAKIASGNYSRQTYNTEVPSTNFTATVQPSGAPVVSAQDCWRISATSKGSFSAGTWYSAVSVMAVTSGGDQSGNALFRIWRSVNANGTAATEITKSRMTGTTVTNLSTTVAQSSSASTQIAAFSLTNEYLFLQVAWQITTAGGANSRDVLVRLGAITNNTNGSFLATSAFSATGAAATASGAGYFQRRKRDELAGLR